jgi:hypothetical protein
MELQADQPVQQLTVSLMYPMEILVFRLPYSVCQAPQRSLVAQLLIQLIRPAMDIQFIFS